MVEVQTGYSPREHQAWIHQRPERFKALVCHRRFGKSVFAINEIIDRGLRNPQKNPQYAYVGPSYPQVKRIAWEYFKDFTNSIPTAKPNESELTLRVNRPQTGDKLIIQLLSAEKPDSIRGMYLDGAVLDEFGEMKPKVWSQAIRPALADRFGWATILGTPKGKNHFFDIFNYGVGDPEWFTQIFKASETGIIDANELRSAKAIMMQEEYDQEFECDFGSALVGAYFSGQMSAADREGRITKVPYDPKLEVHTAWDIGVDDCTAIWFFQNLGRSFNFIGYYENHDKGMDHYVQHVKDQEYNLGTHYFPHDVEVREWGTGKSRIEQLKSAGLKNIYVVPKQSKMDQIAAARSMLPACWFDKHMCSDGIDAMKNYQRKWDEENKVFVLKPLHNWASHGADAFMQFAMGYKDPVKGYNLPREADNSYDVLNHGVG